MSIKEIKKLSVEEASRLTEQELRKVTQIAAKHSNARLTQLINAGIKTHATRNVEKGGGKFRTRGKNRNQLLKEFARAKAFLGSETSTIRGAKSVAAKFEKIVGEELNGDEEKNKFWNVYNEVAKKYPDMLNGYGSEQIMKLVRREINDDLTVDEILSNAEQRLIDLYEGVTENDSEDTDCGEFTTEDYF